VTVGVRPGRPAAAAGAATARGAEPVALELTRRPHSETSIRSRAPSRRRAASPPASPPASPTYRFEDGGAGGGEERLWAQLRGPDAGPARGDDGAAAAGAGGVGLARALRYAAGQRGEYVVRPSALRFHFRFHYIYI
jgi:hypothetical protein